MTETSGPGAPNSLTRRLPRPRSAPGVETDPGTPGTYHYGCYGLTLQTRFACPSLTPVDATDAVDVRVVAGPVARHLTSAELAADNWESAPGSFLVRAGARSGRFLVESGERVTFQPGSRAEPQMIAVRFVASVLPALLRQRGLLVLHGNAVRTPAGTVLICGQSGAGKSTTSAALVHRGDALISDDVTALVATEGGPHVLPGVSQIHLDVDSAHRLDLEIGDAPLQPWRRMKAAITSPRSVATAQPLDALVELIPSNDVHAPTCTTVTGAAAFGVLQRNLYGPTPLAEQQALLPMLADMTARIPVVTIARPVHRWTVTEVLTAIDGLLAR